MPRVATCETVTRCLKGLSPAIAGNCAKCGRCAQPASDALWQENKPPVRLRDGHTWHKRRQAALGRTKWAVRNKCATRAGSRWTCRTTSAQRWPWWHEHSNADALLATAYRAYGAAGAVPVFERGGRCAARYTRLRRTRRFGLCVRSVRTTFFRSGARGLHAPARLTPEPAEREARKRRTSERPRVACCEELGCCAQFGRCCNATSAVHAGLRCVPRRSGADDD